MVSISARLGKPPKKNEVQSFQKTNKGLLALPWLKIKHQVWAMAQSEMKKNKKIMRDLKV